MRVAIASTNPVKIESVGRGFHQAFPGMPIVLVSKSVSSGVSDQPMSDEETRKGAIGRVAALSMAVPDADFWVGIEGGIHATEPRLVEAFAWICVQSRESIGLGRTMSFILPDAVTRLIYLEGKELGEADDIVFGASNSKQNQGAIGLLTRGLIDRTSLYTPAVIAALIPIINPELYP